MEKKKKFKWSMPDTYIILFIIIILGAGATYVLPAGEYDREEVDGVEMVQPDTYETVERNPTEIGDIFIALQEGMIESADLIFLVLFAGGAFGVIEASGSIRAGIMKAVDKFRGREFWLIASITALFALAGAVGVVVNSVIAYVAIGLILARAMKLDPIVAVAITFGAAFAGFNVGFLNPNTVAVAQSIAQLPIYSGIVFRLIVFVVIVGVTIMYVWWYAKKILNDPTKSLMGEDSIKSDNDEELEEIEFSTKHKIILGFVIMAFLTLVFGTIQYDWYINEMAAFFIILGIGAGIIAGLHYNDIIKHFMNGAKNLVYGALIIGVARAVLIVMEDGQIVDTIIFGLSAVLTEFPPVIGAFGMFISSAVINFFIPSGSGQAMVTMPIMTPLADMIGITRQIAVQAFQFGDGFTNSILPTSGPLMASLAIAGVSWIKWARWMLPLLLMWSVIAIIMLTIAVFISWGPM